MGKKDKTIVNKGKQTTNKEKQKPTTTKGNKN